MSQLINGDCIQIMKDMETDSVELTVTDIPYSVVNRDSNGLRNLDKGVADEATFDTTAFVESVVRVTSGSIYIFCSTEQVSEIRSALGGRTFDEAYHLGENKPFAYERAENLAVRC